MCELHNHPWKLYCQDNSPCTDLLRFIHGCSSDDVTSSMAIAATVMTLAQVAGPEMIQRPPGYLLVNAGAAACDPIDQVMKQLTGLGNPKPKGDAESFKRNRSMMGLRINDVIQAILEGRNITKVFMDSRSLDFIENRRLAFGGDRAGYYAARYDKVFGWVADRTNHVILRLDRAEDHARFREDLRNNLEKLITPSGYGDTLLLQPKALSIAGAARAEQWDESLVSGIVERGLPVLFLPHTAGKPLDSADAQCLNMIAVGLQAEIAAHRHDPVVAAGSVFDDAWLTCRLDRLRQRLIHFPATYDYFVQRTIRELDEWCNRLASIVAMDGTEETLAMALWRDLFAKAFHGICLGIESLGWHGYGFHPGCSRQEALNLLALVRKNGAIERRELLRKFQWLNAESRNAILERLEAEGLVTLTGKEVSAVPFADYLSAIPARTGITAPEMRSAAPPVGKSVKSLAAGIAELRAAADRARNQLENDAEFAMADDGVDYGL